MNYSLIRFLSCEITFFKIFYNYKLLILYFRVFNYIVYAKISYINNHDKLFSKEQKMRFISYNFTQIYCL